MKKRRFAEELRARAKALRAIALRDDAEDDHGIAHLFTRIAEDLERRAVRLEA
jgi:hypothetical protein